MKFKFITMTLMICLALTIGVIAVQNSNYPSPFIKNGDSDVAIVVGEDAASSDFLSAINLAQNLQAELIKQTGIKEDSFVITSGSEYLKLEKPSNKFNLGETMLEVWPISLTETDLPFLLGKGTYEDSSGRDYDYNQKIALNDLPLTHFSDSDYGDGEPTIGFRLSSGVNILNYTLDFIKNPLYNEDELEKTKIKILGKEYEIAYVDTTEDKIILFDSNNSQIINEDESVSITLNKETYKVSVLFMNEDIVKLDVNGISTNKLKEGDVYKIKEDVYVNVQEILYSSAENGKRLVEITLGSQKITLEDNQEVKLNEKSVDGLKFYLVKSGDKLDKFRITWNLDEESFLTSKKELTMPIFDVKIVMAPMYFPKEEVLGIDKDGDSSIELKVPIKDGDAFLNILYGENGKIKEIGKDKSRRLVTTNKNNLTFNNTREDEFFVASWASDSEAESYFLSVDIDKNEEINVVTLTNEVTGDEICEDVSENENCVFGNIILTVDEIVREGNNEWVTFVINNGGSFSELYTKEGLKIYLPYQATNSTEMGAIDLNSNPTSYVLNLIEENKDGKIGQGKKFNVTFSFTGDNKITVSDINTGQKEYELENTDEYESYVYSSLATKIIYDTTGTQNTAEIFYHGDESYINLFIGTSDILIENNKTKEVVPEVKVLGSVTVLDKDVNSVKDKNLIVVGGSCINSVAEKILGGAYCGEEFTNKTKVDFGKFLIGVYNSPYNEEKTAVLVAGYEAAETIKAANYLINQKPDTELRQETILS